ncbi:hypothetical protein AC579_3012 [Pseudocercospora musae]|uniref:Uncharacterized protein n=1 Tax=Pseudocercospora musae TaxID=113226 RepID=A0A139I4J0_9PEZI|nr:hypothetical protein AC579_3012 [Pseudocercospora musae]
MEDFEGLAESCRDGRGSVVWYSLIRALNDDEYGGPLSTVVTEGVEQRMMAQVLRAAMRRETRDQGITTAFSSIVNLNRYTAGWRCLRSRDLPVRDRRRHYKIRKTPQGTRRNLATTPEASRPSYPGPAATADATSPRDFGKHRKTSSYDCRTISRMIPPPQAPSQRLPSPPL